MYDLSHIVKHATVNTVGLSMTDANVRSVN